MAELIRKSNRKKLAKLAKDLKTTYDYMEGLFRTWRKKKVPNYQFAYLSKAQEQIMQARSAVLQLLGST